MRDQLSLTLSSLIDIDSKSDIILLGEMVEDIADVKHHKKKIVLLLSAMRHFADTLRRQGYQVLYAQLDDPANTGSWTQEVMRVLQTHAVERVVVTHPSEYRAWKMVSSWSDILGVPVDIRPDTRFLCSQASFATWAKGRKQLRMEYFYREMRKQYRVLMDGDNPMGGRWNYDADNRKPPKSGLCIPDVHHFEPDAMTREVMDCVATHCSDHFGELQPFHFAVTRQQALAVLDDFIDQRLPYFGDYQDAMMVDEPWMYHSHISFYLNCGLLLPQECVNAAENAYRQGQAPLNAVEGFIRQLMGWREYVRGIYWLKMPEYAKANFLEAHRKLPELYWTGQTPMNCLRQCVESTQRYAYAHHIQRLMVLGNFALLVGVDPAEVNRWFLVVYADAYEWVELPNVSGMILFADGGYLASKPYASGGGYIHKMSNYCQGCRYRVDQKQGPNACPFNYLYWHFLASNRHKLGHNPRLRMMYSAYDRMTDDKKKAIQKDSEQFLESLSS